MAFSISWLLLITIIVLVAIVVRAWRPTRKGQPDQPACGQCGYFVQGASSINCPECGADWREVGIKMPPDPPKNVRTSRALAIIMFGVVGLRYSGHLDFDEMFFAIITLVAFQMLAHWGVFSKVTDALRNTRD